MQIVIRHDEKTNPMSKNNRLKAGPKEGGSFNLLGGNITKKCSNHLKNIFERRIITLNNSP